MSEKAIKLIAEPIVVTGGCGFIGQAIINQLINNGQKEIVAFDLPGTTMPAHWREMVQVKFGDITNAAEVDTALANARTIFHLVAIVGDWGAEDLFWNIAVEGSRNIFNAALKNRAHVILASSIVVYGDKLRRQICREEDSYGRPAGIYSRCKQAQEELAWEYHRTKKMPLTVIRPANVYGPGSKPWVHDTIKVLQTGMPSLINGGKFNAGLVYVDNLAELFILAAGNAKSIGRIYNGCDGGDITWQQYFSDLASIAGAPVPKSLPGIIARAGAAFCEPIWRLLQIKNRPPITWESLNLVSADNRISNERARTELGFIPRINYPQAIAEIAAYWQSLPQATHR